MSDEPEKPAASVQLAFRDVLDYIAPGGIFILLIVFFESWAKYELRHPVSAGVKFRAPLRTAIVELFPGQGPTTDWTVSIAVVAVVLAIAYIAGHIVASVSAFLMERTFVFKGYGWPIRWLLGLKDTTVVALVGEELEAQETALLHSKRGYRALFFWINVLLVGMYLLLILRLGRLPRDPFVWTAMVVIAVALLVSMVLLVIKLYARWWSFKRSHGHNGFEQRPLSEREISFVAAAAACYEFPSLAVASVLETRFTFDAAFTRRFRRYFQACFRQTPESAGSNVFWLTYCHVMEHSARFGAMLHHWRMQYAFARNMAASCYLAFLWTGTSLVLQCNSLAHLERYPKVVGVLIPLAFLGMSGLMLLRYYYLFVCYFSRFVVRAFVYTGDMQAKAKARDRRGGRCCGP